MDRKLKRTIIDYLYIVTGSAITALALVLFISPSRLAPGGVSGIGTILYHTLGIDMGLSIFVLSIPLFLAGVKLFGKNYGFKSLAGTLLLSALTSLFGHIFGYDGVLDSGKDMTIWLSSLYGGVLSGLGIGLVIKAGSNTGGTDIAALILARYTHLSAGTSLMIVDGLIIAVSAIFFGLESALFAIVLVFINTTAIDKVVLSMGTGYAKTVYIISDHLDEIGAFILEDLEHSGTIINAKGLYTRQDKDMLMTVIPNQSISRLTRYINELDKKAFLIIQDTHHVLGEGFTPMEKLIAQQHNDVTSQ